MTRQWIAALLPGTVLLTKPGKTATIGVLVVTACALMSPGTAASAHSATDRVHLAFGQTGITEPTPGATGGGGVHETAVGGGGVHNEAVGGGGVHNEAVGGGGGHETAVGGGGVHEDCAGGGGVSDN
jgi:hypothetical protein